MRKCILLLTGNPGVGKSTVVLKVVDSLRAKGYSVGGMVSREVRSNNVRIGFEITDLTSSKRGWLLVRTQASGRKLANTTLKWTTLNLWA